MSTFPTGSGDAIAARVRTDLKVFTDWLTANSVKGLVGEFGWPGSSNAATDPIPGSGTGAHFDLRWDAVAQQWFLDADAKNLFTTNWVASEWRVDLRSYETNDGNNRPLNYRTTVSSVLEQTYGTGGTGIIRGVNLAGGEFADSGPSGGLVAGLVGHAYYYPTVGDWAQLYGRGVRLVRLPFRWERLQPKLNGPLDPVNLKSLQDTVTAAGAAGVKILLDMHNYGRYDTAAQTNTTPSTNGVLDIGQNAPAAIGGSMASCFIDIWTKIATNFSTNAGLWGYGLTNEPHDLTGGVSFWQAITRQAVEAIRLIDTTNYISVGGYFYSTIPGWLQQNGTTAWLTETIPAGQPGAGAVRNTDPKIVFEGHHYWDNDHSGGYAQTYDQELTNATNAGFTSYTNASYTAPATGNTQQTGNRTVFSSSYDGAWDFSGSLDSIPTNSNAVSFVTTAGNPAGSLKVSATATSDSGGTAKQIGAGARTLSVDFLIPVGSTLSTTSNFAITHFWTGTNTDLAEIRVIGSGAGYKVGLTSFPTTTYALINTGNTVLSLGSWYTLTFVITDTGASLYVYPANTVQPTTAEASYTATYTNVNATIVFRGKYYGTAYVGDMYFDNELDSLLGTYYAPPNGGFIGNGTTSAGGTPTPPTTTPPPNTQTYPITIYSWYPYGSPPTATLATIQGQARALYDKAMTFTYETATGVGVNEARIKAPDQTFADSANGVNGTVSEGIGYGMLGTAFYGNSNLPSGIYDSTAQGKFDKLYRYYKNRLDTNGLMNWIWNADGTQGKSGGVTVGGGATDADFDVAFALVIASRQWVPGTGAWNYANEATNLINKILQFEIAPQSGSGWPNRYVEGDLSGFGSYIFHTDYFAPAWFREFYVHTGNTRWLDVINQNYSDGPANFYNTTGKFYNANGLISNLANNLSGYSGAATFGYDNIRYPWRITADYVLNGPNTNSLAKNMPDRLVTSQKTRYANVVANQKAEPAVDYSTVGTYINGGYIQAFGVGGIVSSAHSQWVTDTLTNLANDGYNSYFGDWLAAVSSMLMAGIMQVGNTGTTSTPPPKSRSGIGLMEIF